MCARAWFIRRFHVFKKRERERVFIIRETSLYDWDTLAFVLTTYVIYIRTRGSEAYRLELYTYISGCYKMLIFYGDTGNSGINSLKSRKKSEHFSTVSISISNAIRSRLKANE